MMYLYLSRQVATPQPDEVTMKTVRKTVRTTKAAAANRTETTGKRPKTARRAMPALGRHGGCAATVSVVERTGVTRDEAVQAFVFKTGATAGGGARGRLPRIATHVCEAMAAMGHPQRARLLAKLLEGPATYQALRRATRIEAGPLYHHIGQLRLAGLILPKQRDLYELTRAGRNLVLVAATLGPILKDGRRRPLGSDA